jgi:hypothetical protein
MLSDVFATPDRLQGADDLGAYRECVETLRDDHHRTYKIRPMLDELLDEFCGDRVRDSRGSRVGALQSGCAGSQPLRRWCPSPLRRSRRTIR